MKQKCKKLSACSFLLAVLIFAISYVLYHYTIPGGAFTVVWQPQPGKPWITLLFAIWGVMLLFAGVMSLLVGRIFFGDEKTDESQSREKQ